MNQKNNGKYWKLILMVTVVFSVIAFGITLKNTSLNNKKITSPGIHLTADKANAEVKSDVNKTKMRALKKEIRMLKEKMRKDEKDLDREKEEIQRKIEENNRKLEELEREIKRYQRDIDRAREVLKLIESSK